MAEIEDIDLSEFGLDLPADGTVGATGPSAMLSDDELPADVLAELGMADLDPPATATNGQAPLSNNHAASDPLAEFLGEVPEPHAGSSVTSSPQHVLQQMPTLPEELTPQNATPNAGFGILEQILSELTNLRIGIAGIRQMLSNPGGSGPSMLPSTQGAQRTPSAAPSASGTDPITAGATSRPRRSRGRPKKEEDEFNIE